MRLQLGRIAQADHHLGNAPSAANASTGNSTAQTQQAQQQQQEEQRQRVAALEARAAQLDERRRAADGAARAHRQWPPVAGWSWEGMRAWLGLPPSAAAVRAALHEVRAHAATAHLVGTAASALVPNATDIWLRRRAGPPRAWTPPRTAGPPGS